MRKGTITIALTLLIVMNITQVAGLMAYSSVIQVGPNGGTTITWNITASPDVPVTWGWSGDGRWLAEAGSKMSFEINKTSPDIAGTLTLGNFSIYANDTDIARELVLGVWGITQFFPGLVVENDDASLSKLNDTAYSAAARVKGNYLNGTMESYYDEIVAPAGAYSCIVFEYEQDPTAFGEPQKTTLAYDLDTGILVWANTSYSFGTPYVLTLALESIVQPLAPIHPAIIYGTVTVVAVIVIAILIIKRR